MKRLQSYVIGVIVALVSLAGCASESVDGPPEVRYGESVCDACGMILSDERYATATMVEGDRGPEPKLFDDFNCQQGFETKDPAPEVVSRWVHDHETLEWLSASAAYYVRSSNLRTPMASGMAAFATREGAQKLAAETDGEVLTFDELR